MIQRLRHVVAGLLMLGVAPIAGCHRSPAAAETRVLAPLPRRVTVEVLNAGRVLGAARAATLRLRHAGLDVVYFGNPDGRSGVSVRNQILVRRGDTTGVGRVIEALGDGAVIDAPDSTRLVDLTVLLGSDFGRPPAPSHR